MKKEIKENIILQLKTITHMIQYKSFLKCKTIQSNQTKKEIKGIQLVKKNTHYLQLT